MAEHDAAHKLLASSVQLRDKIIEESGDLSRLRTDTNVVLTSLGRIKNQQELQNTHQCDSIAELQATVEHETRVASEELRELKCNIETMQENARKADQLKFFPEELKQVARHLTWLWKTSDPKRRRIFASVGCLAVLLWLWMAKVRRRRQTG